ncbi:MAG: terminase gpA endonuclease subunit [Motiliproteus sp.]
MSAGLRVQGQLAAEYEAAKGSQNALIKVVNQKLGLPYEIKGDQATAEELRERAEEYPPLVIPRAADRIALGIDVPPDRLALMKGCRAFRID